MVRLKPTNSKNLWSLRACLLIKNAGSCIEFLIYACSQPTSMVLTMQMIMQWVVEKRQRSEGLHTALEKLIKVKQRKREISSTCGRGRWR